jgi:hypothetical protein
MRPRQNSQQYEAGSQWHAICLPHLLLRNGSALSGCQASVGMSIWQWAFLAWIVLHSIGDMSRALKVFRDGSLPPSWFAVLTLILAPMPYALAWAAGLFS